MKTKSRHIVGTLAALLVLGFVFALVLQRGGTASAYPPPATPTQSTGLPSYAYSIYVPDVSLLVAPASTTSIYVVTTTATTMYNLGYSYGGAGTGGFVILDFGQPFTSSTQSNALQGVRLFNEPSHTFVTTATVQTAAENFMRGWWYGYLATGSSIAPSAQITVGIGLNNCGYATSGSTAACIPGGPNYANHAKAWAQLVINLRAYINQPPSYASKEFVVAADDIEPHFNDSPTTRVWVDNYYNYFSTVPTTTVKMYNFGSCDSCPFVYPDGTGCPLCSSTFTETRGDGTVFHWTWSPDDIRYTAWGAPLAWPIVEIYETHWAHAYQWYQLSVYNYDHYASSPIRFQGTVTQSQSCAQNGCDPSLANSPSDGWLQLWQVISSDTKTRLSNSDMLYATDFKYQ